MPTYPNTARSVSAISGSVFSALARKRAESSGEIYPLHVGDTWMEPAVGCRMEDLRVEELSGVHRYSPPRGLPALVEALAVRSEARTGVPTEPANVLVTAGATGGLAAAVGALVEPDDEVLLLAPYWPLIPGIVSSFHGRPVAVPFFGRVDSPESAVEEVRRHHTPRSVAIYLNSPNNPTGEVIPGSWMEALVEWAQSEGLWILCDEVYEEYVYRGKHTYCRALAPERAVCAHSFSKAYGMAGNRCGWAVGPAEIMSALRKVSIHTVYSTPTASQHAALRALGEAGDAWLANARDAYRGLGERAADRLGVDRPRGSTFLFLDVSARLGPGGLPAFLERCAARGLFLAPGPSFGPYPSHVRLCFTSAAPDVVARGVDVLAELLGR